MEGIIGRSIWVLLTRYTEPSDKLLSHWVYPLISELKSHSLLDRFYFSRHYQSNPHLRLRIKTPANKVEETTQRIRQHLADETDRFDLVSTDQPLQLDTYGSKADFVLLEPQLCFSSDLLLSILAEKESQDYEDMLRLAFLLDLGLIYSFYRDKKSCIAFFEYYIGQWMDHTLNYVRRDTADATPAQVSSLFEERFAGQKPQLADMGKSVMAWIDGGGAYTKGEKWLPIWIHELGVQKEELLSLRPEFLRAHTSDPTLRDTDAIYRSLLESFVHMQHNRLGLFNADEAYLAYLIKRTLEYS